MKQDDVEPTTNQNYGSLLTNITFIKSFASRILVPRAYIWPLDDALYLQPHTSVVSDTHKEGLEVFAVDFVSDGPFSYNYSYDPVAEYLSFVDNGDFSVDGVLSDFPITSSAAIGCYALIWGKTFQDKRIFWLYHTMEQVEISLAVRIWHTRRLLMTGQMSLTVLFK